MSAEGRVPKKAKEAARPPWPAETVEKWPLARISPYVNNARTHGAAGISLIAESISRFGIHDHHQSLNGLPAEPSHLSEAVARTKRRVGQAGELIITVRRPGHKRRLYAFPHGTLMRSGCSGSCAGISTGEP